MSALDLQTGAADGTGWSADTEPADSPAGASAAPSPASMPPSTSAGDTETQDGVDADDLHDLERAKQIRSENRNLRTRAKTAEAERDALAAELQQYRRQQVEAVAREVLRDPADLLDRHADLSAFTVDGSLSLDAVRSAAATLVAERPHLAAEPIVTAPPSNRPLEGLRAGASPERTPTSVTWKDVIGRGL